MTTQPPLLSWHDFVGVLRSDFADPVRASGTWWRGQSRNWPLASTWERFLMDHGVRDGHRLEATKRLLEIRNAGLDGLIQSPFEIDAVLEITRKHLREDARTSIPSAVLKSDLATLAIGRHYGLNTPLLDWTESPYFAAFIAYSEAIQAADNDPTCPVVAAIDNGSFVAARTTQPDIDFISRDQITPYEHPLYERLSCQLGCFTWNRSLEFTTLESEVSRISRRRIRKFMLNIEDAPVALRELASMGISYRSLFPGMDGIARQVNLEVYLSQHGIKFHHYPSISLS